MTSRFLADNKLLYIVRSHECVQYGYDLTHDDQVRISSPNRRPPIAKSGGVQERLVRRAGALYAGRIADGRG